MKFEPKTREEAMSIGLLKKGDYPFQVISAKEKISQNGNPMIALMLRVWDESGGEHNVFDNLMMSVEYKLRHFCYSVGLGEMSEKGEFDCDLVINKMGVCKLYIQEDKNGQYPPKNSVADYLINNDNEANLTLKKTSEINNDFKDDDVPF